uniref:Uncharacterized protein n=1 Tax=Anguilla anguilla TaxID=7936 RepID=A0A0E9WPC9_ANGAN
MVPYNKLQIKQVHFYFTEQQFIKDKTEPNECMAFSCRVPLRNGMAMARVIWVVTFRSDNTEHPVRRRHTTPFTITTHQIRGNVSGLRV